MASQLKQIEIKIEELLREKDWPTAYKLCLEVLRFDPENGKFAKLKTHIENEVKKHNQLAIEQEIKNYKILLDQHQYEEYLKKLLSLKLYNKDYLELDNLILKARENVEIDLKEKQRAYLQDQFIFIDKLNEEHKYEEAITLAEKLLALKFHQNILQKKLKITKDTWIKYELEQNQSLLNTESFEAIILLYIKLLKIEPKNKNLQNKLARIKRLNHLSKVDLKKDVIYKTLEDIRTLYQLKKYDKLLELAENILDIDAENHQAKTWRRLANIKLRYVMSKEIRSQINKNYQILKKEFANYSSEFVKI